jgi:hypothetical protein
MKNSKSNLIAILVIASAVLAATNASAGGFSFGGGGGGGGGGNKGGFKISFGGNNHNHLNHHGHHHHHKYHHHHVRYYEPVRYVYSQCYHPLFRVCFVYPGDTWYTISKKMYGVDFLCRHIASYNGLSLHSPLLPGQQLRIPVVNTNGTLSASGAPLPPAFVPQGIPVAAQGAPIGPQTTQFGPTSFMVAPNTSATQGSPVGLNPQGLNTGLAPQGLPGGASITPIQNSLSTPNGPTTSAAPAASIRPAKVEPALPRVSIGSTLVLDGTSLGEEKGIVRLRISDMTLPVEVLEWSASSVKIELPKIDMSRPLKADLEVVRADGSVASSTAIELSPAATRLALGN